MADFILGRLKFKWKGPWVTGTAYIIDDIVKYGANTYTCIVNHTADASFYTDLDTNSYWSLHTESFHYNTTSPNSMMINYFTTFNKIISFIFFNMFRYN